MKAVGVVTIVIIAVVALSAGAAFIFSILWNFVMRDTFGLPALNFWTAWAFLAILSFIGAPFRTMGNLRRNRDS